MSALENKKTKKRRTQKDHLEKTEIVLTPHPHNAIES